MNRGTFGREHSKRNSSIARAPFSFEINVIVEEQLVAVG